jgi:hypothetical protein
MLILNAMKHYANPDASKQFNSSASPEAARVSAYLENLVGRAKAVSECGRQILERYKAEAPEEINWEGEKLKYVIGELTKMWIACASKIGLNNQELKEFTERLEAEVPLMISRIRREADKL